MIARRWLTVVGVALLCGLWVPCAGAATRRVAAIGFSPGRNGFAFQNYGNTGGITNLTPVQMQRLFGSAVCASGSGASCVLSPPALQWMVAQNQLMANGHCEGLAISSLLFARRTLNPAAYGGRVPTLKLGGNASLQGLIAYTYAFGALSSVERASLTADSPMAVVRRLIAVLRAGQEQWVLHIFKADMSGGHAVTPYAVDSLGHGRYGILIYDNNWPRQVRTITVDSKTDSWSYQATQNPHDKSELYSGTASTHTLQLWNLTPGLQVQPCPFCAVQANGVPGGTGLAGVTGNIDVLGVRDMMASASTASRERPALAAGRPAGRRVEVVLAGAGAAASRVRLLVRGLAGHAVGFNARGRFVNRLPGASVRWVTNGAPKSWTDPAVPVLDLPDTGGYTMSLQGQGSSSTAQQALSLIGPGFSAAVDGLALTGNDDALVTTSASGAMTFQLSAGAAQAPRLVLGVGDDILTVTPVGLTAGQAVGLSADPTTGVLTITPSAQGQVQLSIQVDRENPDGSTDVFASGPVIQTGGGDAPTTVSYGAWSGGTAPMTIQQGSNAPQQIANRPDLAVEQDPNGGFGTIPTGVPATPVTVSSVAPAAVTQGSSVAALTITGTGFQAGAQVSFSQPGVTVNSTTFVSGSQLTENISVSALAPVGPVDVTVSDPNGRSATGSGLLTIDPAETVTGVNPSIAGRGARSLPVTVTGTGFQSGAQIAFSGTGVTVSAATFLDASHLTATITVALDATLGPIDVTVSEPDGTSATGSGSFTVGPGPLSFAPARTVALGSPPDWLAAGDLNRDGIPDLVVALGTANAVSVSLGNGDGTFQAPQTYAVGSNPESVAIGDFNGDGKPDLAVTNYFDGTVSVLLGNGDGTFQAQHTYAVGTDPHSCTVADLSGDGKLDLVCANGHDDTVSVLLGNGDGTFQPQHTFAVGRNPQLVAIADFNGDGKLDLATSNYDTASTVSVLLGNGDGTFQTQHTYPVGPLTTALAVGDFNGDGKPDLATASTSAGTVSVLLGNGDGSFQTQQAYPAGANPTYLAVADFDGDGKQDLVVTNGSAGTVSVLQGNGDGTFQTPQTYTVGSDPLSVAVADVNGDHQPDIVTSNNTSSTLSVLLDTTRTP